MTEITATGRTQRTPLLAQPWAGGVAGWLVVVVGLIAELIAGVVTNSAPTAVAAVTLMFPVAAAISLSIAQWHQVRSCGADRVSWWHLSGIAAALVTWQLFPTFPGLLYGTGSASSACAALIGTPTAECLTRARTALDARTATWWLTGVAILLLALLVRRSRIAAWAAIPVALGGCLLATHFLELLLLHYRPNG